MAHILIIDDEPDVCDVLRYYLEGESHRVDHTTSPGEVGGILDRITPDLILLDVLMPEANGLELVPQIKNAAPDCYIIVITGVNDYHVTDLLYESGIHGLLSKPIKLPDLSSAIRGLLDRPARSL